MTATLAAIGDFNGLAVAIFAVVLAITLVITSWAARRTRNATEFYTAGRGVAGAFNGIAIAGDYLSASTFLGYAGLMSCSASTAGSSGWRRCSRSCRCSTCSPIACATRASSPLPTCSATACAGAPFGWPPRSTPC